jgi:hypothetical protein
MSLKMLTNLFKKLYYALRYPGCKHKCEMCGCPYTAGRPYAYHYNPENEQEELGPLYFPECSCYFYKESDYD